MRYYSISPIALNVEKKGVDAVRRVSLFQSVTASVGVLFQSVFYSVTASFLFILPFQKLYYLC
jgi:hypothetical protein